MPPLERARELETVAALATRAAEGAGAVVVIEGPAGIGKSAVLDEARRRAKSDAGLRLLGSRGSQLERDFPFGVARQLFERVARGRELPAGAAAALTDAAEGGGDRGFAALHGLYLVADELSAQGPLLLAVDDLQWADEPSLRFLAYLARRIEDLPVLVLATVRQGEPDVDEALLAAVRQAPAVVLEPGPLSEEAAGTVLAERLGQEPDPAFAAACHAATSGNPLLLRELAGALEHEGVTPVAGKAALVRSVGPRAVSRTVSDRLARLDANAVAAARAVAVLGDGAGVELVARLAELDEQQVAAASGVLARADILEGRPPLRFVHPLVAQAVLDGIPPGARELQHAAAATLLTEAQAPAEQIAGHLLRTPAGGGRTDWVGALRSAAATAVSRGAADTAARMLERALAEPPTAEQRPEVMLELGLAESFSRIDRAVVHLTTALGELTDPAQRSVAARALAPTLLFAGRPDDARALAREVADSLPDHLHDDRDQLRAFAHHVVWFHDPDQQAIVGTASLRDRMPGADATAGEAMLAATCAFAWHHEPGPREACAALSRAAMANGRLLEVDGNLTYLAAPVVLAAAEDPAGIGGLEAAVVAAHRRGSLSHLIGARLHLTLCLTHVGDLAAAEAAGRQVLEHLELWGSTAVWDYARGYLASILVARGDLEEARRTLGTASGAVSHGEGMRGWNNAALALAVAERRDAEARGVLERLVAGWPHVRNPMTAQWLLHSAVLHHRAGETDGVREDLDAALADAQRWGAPGPIGRALRMRGELLDDLEALHEAVDVLAGSAVRAESAKALLAVGRRLRIGGAPTEAREPLREALAQAASCGADGIAAIARTELAASGLRPRQDALRGPDALTPSERRIADLAAAGRTNRDIAEELFVTPKTVETHLSAVYRKLDISSRHALANALGPPRESQGVVWGVSP